MTNFKLETDDDGIALVTWDMPGRSMNVLDGDVLAELSDIIEKATADAAVKGVVITSGKDAFCAGADLNVLQKLGDAYVKTLKAKGEEAAAKEFLRFKFETVFTTKIDWSGPGDEGPEESITFVYGKLGIRYSLPGSGMKPVVGGWDQVTNKAADDFAAG